MKHLALLFCVSFFVVTAPAPTARADVSVSIGFFYDALDPYGDWIYTPSYGYVWQPAAARQPSWAPYSDGYWAYTDAGWTWISYEDFGWATYHYGRWIRMNHHWCWVPGYEWAPAWVSWRQADDYVGWAPLPPEARWFVNIGFSSWADSHYDIGPSCYNFVPMRMFSSRSSLNPFIMDRSRNVTYVDRSVNITNITYRNNVVNNIFVGGPDPSRIDRISGSPVRRLTLRRDEDSFRRDWMDRGRDRERDGGRGRPDSFRSLSRIEDGELLVAAPTVRREEAPAQPSRVRDRFDRPEIDRGWRDVGDAKAAERLRDRHRDELSKISRDRMPEKAPLIVTGKVPPAQLDKRGPSNSGPGRVDEEVRKAVPQRPEMPARVQDQPPKALPQQGAGKPVNPFDRDGPPGRDGLPGRGGMPGRDRDDRPGLPPGMEPRKMPERALPGQPNGPAVKPVIPEKKPTLPTKPQARPTMPTQDEPPRRIMPSDVRPGGGAPMPKKVLPPKVSPDMPGRSSRPPSEVRRMPSPPEMKPRAVPMPKPETSRRAAPSMPQMPQQRLPAPPKMSPPPQVKPAPAPKRAPAAPSSPRPGGPPKKSEERRQR